MGVSIPNPLPYLLNLPSLIGYFFLVPAVIRSFLFGRPFVDENDPLENYGSFIDNITREELQVPFLLDGEDEITIDAELYIPQDNDNHRPFGMVLFLPGFQASYRDYDDFSIHMASHGYLVAGMDYPSEGTTASDNRHDLKAEQALAVIEYIQNIEDYSNLFLPVVTAGHSLGGKIAFYAAVIGSNSTFGGFENTIAGVMALDPVNAGGPPCFVGGDACANYPVAANPSRDERGLLYQLSYSQNDIIATLNIRSAPDIFTNPEREFNARWFYYGTNNDNSGFDAVPSPAIYYDFGLYPHIGYTSFFRTIETSITRRTMVAFLNQYLLGIDQTEYLTGEIIQNDVDAGRFESVTSR